jgi:hypothetical protein
MLSEEIQSEEAAMALKRTAVASLFAVAQLGFAATGSYARTDEFVIDSAGLYDLTWTTSNGNSPNTAKLGNGAISFTLIYD